MTMLEQPTGTSRRAMLKKVAATSAAAGLTVTVISSKAFADGGSQGSRPTGIGGSVSPLLSNITSTTFDISASGFAAGSCSFDNSTPTQAYLWEIASAATGGASASISPTGSFSGSVPATVTYAPPPTGPDLFLFQVKLTVRWVCPSKPDGTKKAWRCAAFQWLIVHNGGAFDIFSTTTTPSPNSACENQP